MSETGSRPSPSHAQHIPATNAAIPTSGDVASMIAGNVITARVMYGT